MIVGKSLVTARSASTALDSGASFARLILRKKDGADIVVSLRHRTNLVGSADGCRVRIRSSDIAPLHAVITRDPTGLQIRRLDPDGLLELNRESIDVSYLHDGDKIRVGPVSMRLSTNLQPVESTALLEKFAEHVKTRLNLENPDLPAIVSERLASSDKPQSHEMASESVHRWQQLAEQLEQQERLLGQVERGLTLDTNSSDPKVRRQVQQLSDLHERIRNEISVLRMWMGPKAPPSVIESIRKKPKRPQPQEPRQSTVSLHDSYVNEPGAVSVDNFLCDVCSGFSFARRRLRWVEWPLWVFFMRGVECSNCLHQTLHFGTKIKPIE
jgi:hypothetical protein